MRGCAGVNFCGKLPGEWAEPALGGRWQALTELLPHGWPSLQYVPLVALLIFSTTLKVKIMTPIPQRRKLVPKERNLGYSFLASK